MTESDPLSSGFLQATGDKVRLDDPPTLLDIGYHGHPLRKIARELLRIEGADEQDVAWMLYDLARGGDKP